MSTLILGIGDLGATKNPDDLVKTFALGSCVAVIMLDPKTRTAGMVHCALPEARINPAKAQERPGYFADSGIPALLREMARHGCDPSGRGFIVKLAGGAKVMDPNDTFNIGKRNLLAAKKILWAHGLGAVAEDVGGNFSRTVTITVHKGEVWLSSPGRPNWKL
ncbi:CheD, stimulates methylation of MCP proteins [Geoalkalibacter ferrihydriticus]|uniref:Probable chemoreceptor glutamine deamidase CheD n=2 Tax=Geoalkalibacter ferrihydriticus TaxID=392333 RepID=A0A0C2HXV8_9BACT|nr:chemotaxis protein CheD [Geoalkalibacter ferrihydriticus]KIH77577.1 chemotaxis protein CheD [Geoalkalibacter ferrihydriticus DSM 17813]SDL68865.1 CheD, stimulates methylation of MCP proteins [Geoalkalibacter ferrihydriticus]